MGIFGYIYHSCKNSVVRDLIFIPATYSIWAPNIFLFGDILLKHYHSGEARLEASFSLPFMNFTVCISTFNWKDKRISILTVLYFSIYVLEKKICKELHRLLPVCGFPSFHKELPSPIISGFLVLFLFQI